MRLLHKYQSRYGREGAVVELPPSIRTINCNGRYYRISWPYQIFVVHFYKEDANYSLNSASLFFGLAPLPEEKENGKIFHPKNAFPHRNIGGVLCFRPIINARKFQEAVEQFVSAWWQEKFRYVLGHSRDYGERERMANIFFERWAKLTKENPNFWSSGDFFEKYPHDISSYCNRY